MDKLAFEGSGSGGTGDEQPMTTEQRIQDEIAGDDVRVSILERI